MHDEHAHKTLHGVVPNLVNSLDYWSVAANLTPAVQLRRVQRCTGLMSWFSGLLGQMNDERWSTRLVTLCAFKGMQKINSVEAVHLFRYYIAKPISIFWKYIRAIGILLFIYQALVFIAITVIIFFLLIYCYICFLCSFSFYLIEYLNSENFVSRNLAAQKSHCNQNLLWGYIVTNSFSAKWEK